MMANEASNKLIVRRWLEQGFNERKLEIFLELLAEDFIHHGHGLNLEQFKARRLEYHMALEEDFYNQYEIVAVRERKVRYGETLWSICSNGSSEGSGEIPIWLFKKYIEICCQVKITKNPHCPL